MDPSSLLDVYVNDRLVGTLGPTGGGAFAFTYLPGVPAAALGAVLPPVFPPLTSR